MINQVGCYGINMGRIDFYFTDDAILKGNGKAIIVS
jgi:5'-nucleotidase